MFSQSNSEFQPIVDRIMCIAHWVKLSHLFSIKNTQLHGREVQILWLIVKSKRALSSQELAQKLSITPGAVTQLIDQLIAKNLVVRQSCSADRRRVELFLTSTAKLHLRELKNQHLACLEPMFSALDDLELAQLIKLLNKVSLPLKPVIKPDSNQIIKVSKKE